MKSTTLVLFCLLGAISPGLGKPYDLPSEHLTVSVSDDWKVTTESDELFGVTNANDDSFTITVNPVGRQLDIQHSTILNDTKAGLVSKGMEIVKGENLSFHGRNALAILAKKTKLGFTFYIYEIITTQENDVVSFILVGDSDPSQQPQFQAILDTVSFGTTFPPASKSNSPAPTR